MKKLILSSVFALALLTCFAGLVYAVEWTGPSLPSTGSGYDVTTNYQGIDVPPGTTVTAYAATTDNTVVSVTFLWKNPLGNTVTTIVDSTPTTYTYGALTIYVFESSYAPGVDGLGDWGVQALFQDSGGQTIQGIERVIAVRAASFNVIPEIPIIGTIGASLAMLAGFAYKLKRKSIKY